MKGLKIIGVFALALVSNVVIGQDSLYHMKNGVVTYATKLTDVDSIIFYRPAQLATITTHNVTNITSNSAVVEGTISSDGGGIITSRGFCWGTVINPTTADNIISNGSGTGYFINTLTGLSGGVTYYVRAYATNSAGTSYGNMKTFTTAPSTNINYGGGVTDIDGNTYKSIIIGNQEWIAENLKVTTYNDGSSIPNVANSSQWNSLYSGAYRYYKDDKTTYASLYGAYYNWYAVNTGKLCPTGWHVPSDSEWMELIDFLQTDGHGGNEAVAIKSTTGWLIYNGLDGNGTDDYGFNAVGGGSVAGSGNFDGEKYYAYWWSSTFYDSYTAWSTNVTFSTKIIQRSNLTKQFGYSVRCLKD